MQNSEPSIFLVAPERAQQEFLERSLSDLNVPILSYRTLDNAIRNGHRDAPGCLVMYVKVLDESSLSALDTVIERGNKAALLVTETASIPAVVRAIKRGALDVIEQRTAGQRLTEAACLALDKARRRHDDAARGEQARRMIRKLTPREREVLQCIANGLSGPEIARELRISRRTVDAHRWRIRQKLQVSHMNELIRTALLADVWTTNTPEEL